MEKNPFRIYQWFSSSQHCCLLLFSCRSNWKKAWYLSVYSFIRFYQDFIKSILSIVNSKCMNDDYDYCCCCCCWIYSIIIIFFFWKPKDNNNKMKRKSTNNNNFVLGKQSKANQRKHTHTDWILENFWFLENGRKGKEHSLIIIRIINNRVYVLCVCKSMFNHHYQCFTVCFVLFSIRQVK